MFKFSKLTILFALVLGIVLVSCKKDDDEPKFPAGITSTQVTINNETYTVLAGSFDSDFRMAANTKWLISGGVFVNDGVTLTIEAGTTIYAADDQTTPFLSVARGGKIMAEGTATAPIVLTTIKTVTGGAAPGDWGGIIVNGRASINVVGGTAEGEGGTGTYGGTDDNDNSGTIKYMRVEYAGKILGTDNELNGFSFNGVGRGTTVEYIQAFRGSDDGIEFFGGTVNVKYAISTGNQDDQFDWTFGWRGYGQFWVVEQNPNDDGDRGIEADGNSSNNSLQPFSDPILANLTFLGATNSTTSPNTGMRLREGTKGEIYNAIVTGFNDSGVRVTNNDTAGPDGQSGTADDVADNGITTGYVTSGDLVMKNSVVFGNTRTSGGVTSDSNFRGADAWANDATNSTTAITLTGFVGSTTTNAMNPSTLNPWFTASSFIGAVENATNDWTKGWALNVNGTVR